MATEEPARHWVMAQFAMLDGALDKHIHEEDEKQEEEHAHEDEEHDEDETQLTHLSKDKMQALGIEVSRAKAGQLQCYSVYRLGEIHFYR